MKILYRPRNCPSGTPYREGYAVYNGAFIEIGHYRGSPWKTTYLLNELEIIEQE